MEHTTRIELENLKDLHAVELGVRKSEDVRRLTIENAWSIPVQRDSAYPNRLLTNSDSLRSAQEGCKPQTGLQNALSIQK